MSMPRKPVNRTLSAAIAAFTINNHLVRIHFEAGREQFLESAGATFKIEHLMAVFAHEKVVMLVAIQFVVRWYSSRLDFSDLTRFHEFFKCTINRSQPQVGRLDRSGLE